MERFLPLVQTRTQTGDFNGNLSGWREHLLSLARRSYGAGHARRLRLFPEAGTLREKNQVNALVKIIGDFAVATIAYFFIGYSITAWTFTPRPPSSTSATATSW